MDDRGHVVIFQEFPAFNQKSCSPFEFSIFSLENEFFVNSFSFDHVIEKFYGKIHFDSEEKQVGVVSQNIEHEEIFTILVSSLI